MLLVHGATMKLINFLFELSDKLKYNNRVSALNAKTPPSNLL